MKLFQSLRDQIDRKVEFSGQLQPEKSLTDLIEEHRRFNFHHVNDTDDEKRFSYHLSERTAFFLNHVQPLLVALDIAVSELRNAQRAGREQGYPTPNQDEALTEIQEINDSFDHMTGFFTVKKEEK